MSDSYTKLFSSITESTIWQEPSGTRLVWITMLAKCNRHGEFYGSVPGLARLSNVTLDEAAAAIQTLLAPDAWSRTKDHDGRRIEEIDGGWRLLNHAKFDRLRSAIEAEERTRERKREWDREHRGSRPRADQRTPDVPPTESDDIRQSPTESDPPPTPDVPPEAKAFKTLAPRAGRTSARFADFWTAFPSRPGTHKGKKKDCLRKWEGKRLDTVADLILADIALRLKKDRQWLDGYMPDPLSYLNQERWLDGFSAAATYAPVASNGTGKKNIFANPESPVEQAEAWARQARAAGVLPETDIAAHVARVRAKMAAITGDTP